MARLAGCTSMRIWIAVERHAVQHRLQRLAVRRQAVAECVRRAFEDQRQGPSRPASMSSSACGLGAVEIGIVDALADDPRRLADSRARAARSRARGRRAARCGCRHRCAKPALPRRMRRPSAFSASASHRWRSASGKFDILGQGSGAHPSSSFMSAAPAGRFSLRSPVGYRNAHRPNATTDAGLRGRTMNDCQTTSKIRKFQKSAFRD